MKWRDALYVAILAFGALLMFSCKAKPKPPETTVADEYKELYTKCKQFRDTHPDYKEIKCGKEGIFIKVK